MDAKEEWEKEDKREIEKRLKLSNKDKWKVLTFTERQAVINKYYNLRGIEHLGIDKILDDNRNIRLNFSFLLLGLLLGILGSLFANIIIQFEPKNQLINIFMLLLLAFFFWYIIKLMDKMSVEHLYQEDVLDHLLKLVKQDTPEKDNSISRQS
jgi:hypothetical protein